MKKKAYIIIIVAFALMMYLLYQPAMKSIFTEKLGDMTLTRYDTGDVAAKQISNMYGIKEIPLAKAYSAVYSSNHGTMQIWAVESPDHNIANDAYNTMNSMLGGSSVMDDMDMQGEGERSKYNEGHDKPGMMNDNFTKPEKLDFMEFTKPDVYMIRDNNTMNYYYFKMNYNMGRVYWIIFNSTDMDYQVSMVKEAVINIK